MGLLHRAAHAKVGGMVRFLAYVVLTGLIAAGLAGCASEAEHFYSGETINGYATWYGAEFQGRPTSSGETFDMHQLTAASRHLPFGTMVRVTNQLNSSSVVVRINDRGPWGDDKRIIDVSSAAADILRMKGAGIIPVQLEIVSIGSGQRVRN